MWNTNDLLLMGYVWVRSCRGIECRGVEPGHLWPFEDTLRIGLCLEDRHAATFIARWQGAISFMCTSSHAVNSTQWTHPSSSTPPLWDSRTVTGGQKLFEKRGSYHHTFYNRLTWWSKLELWLAVKKPTSAWDIKLCFSCGRCKFESGLHYFSKKQFSSLSCTRTIVRKLNLIWIKIDNDTNFAALTLLLWTDLS